MYARLKDPRVHKSLKRYSYSAGSGKSGLKFFVTHERDKDWKQITEQQKRFLENVYSIHGDSTTPKCFEFCSDDEFAKMRSIRLAQTATIDDPSAVEAVRLELEAEEQKKRALEAFGPTDIRDTGALTTSDMPGAIRRRREKQETKDE